MKRTLFYGIVAVSSSVVTYLLVDKEKREKYINKAYEYSRVIKLRKNKSFPIEQAGDPGLDNLSNADMVSEGSQYGVEYYNKLKRN